MNHLLRIPFAFWLGIIPLCAQSTLEGYVFETNNRGYLNQVKMSVFDLSNNALLAETDTDADGHFSFNLPPGQYQVRATKDIFFEKSDTLLLGKEKSFLPFELKRRPGYLFDATIAEARESPDQVVDAVQGATIEIYNRTTQHLELNIQDDEDAFFNFTFERGNHYTLLIRKEGFLSKRIEVFVNINGCIICIDGVRDVAPGVVDNLAAGHAEGTLLANIELDRAKIDKRIQIQNIYYDYDKWDIRADAAERLDQVVTLMKDNPGISVELGSHTDSRGNDAYNLTLSQRRAAAAVAYIVSEGVDSSHISARGYGESQLVNRCKNGVECSEEQHQQNRRTELRITGISEKTTWLTLPQIIENESIESEKKGKSKPRTRLKEANNEVALPTLKPAMTARGDAAAPAPTPSETTPVSAARPSLPPMPTETVRILPLPTTFKGYAVELTRSEVALPPTHPTLQGHKEVFRLLEDDGKFSYLLVNLGNTEAAKAFFAQKIKPKYVGAKLVLYQETGKEIIE